MNHEDNGAPAHHQTAEQDNKKTQGVAVAFGNFGGYQSGNDYVLDPPLWDRRGKPHDFVRFEERRGRTRIFGIVTCRVSTQTRKFPTTTVDLVPLGVFPGMSTAETLQHINYRIETTGLVGRPPATDHKGRSGSSSRNPDSAVGTGEKAEAPMTQPA